MDLPPPALMAPRGPCIHAAARTGARPPGAFEIRSAAYPLVGHYDRAEDLSTAEVLLAALERSWEVQVVQLGFRAPVPDTHDGPELDFYLIDQDPYYAWTAGDSLVDSVPGDGASSTAAYIAFSRDIPPELVEPYSAHEFNHILQWSTDFTEASLPIWEGTATAAQSWTLGEAGLWYLDIPSFQEVPGAPTLLSDGYVLEPRTGLGTYFEYGTALWVMHLDRQLGTDRNAGVELWEATASEGELEPDAVDAAIEVAGGFDELMNGIARSRWLVGDWWDERGFPEAATWGPEFVVAHTVDIPETWRPEDVFITGQAFGTIDATGLAGTMTIEASSPTDLQLSMIVFWRGAGGVGEASGRTVTVESLDGVDEIVVAVSNQGPPSWDAEDGPYEVGDLVVSWAHRPECCDIVDEELPRGCGCMSGSRMPRWPIMLWLAVFALAGRRFRR